jgi:hypothetical protein
VVVDPPTLIRTSAEITPAWLTSVLRADGALGGGRVVDLDATFVGNGLMGVCVRAGLRTEGASDGAPTSVVVKLAAEDDDTRAFMGQVGYRNELCFYQHLAPTLAVRSPRCSFAAIEGDWFTLVLEDLAPAQPGDQLVGLTVEQVRLAVHELVGLHAPRWGDPELLAHPCLVASRAFGPDELQAGLAAVIPGFLERYADALTPEQVDFYARLAKGAATWMRARPEPTTVIHSDYRPDNLLFGTPAGGPPVAVVDWQGLGLGSGTADVGFIVGGALAVEERRTHEDALLREYHAALVAAGVDQSWERCRDDYRASLLSGLLTTIFGAMYGTRTDRGDAMFRSMAHRHAQQVLDLGADSLLG